MVEAAIEIEHMISGLASVLGWRAASVYLIQRRRRSEPGSVFRIQPRSSMHPLFVRRGSSDVDVFDQIFIQHEYRCLDDLTEVRLVIDCGANVGYSSAYFLSRHPKSRIVAIEPDPENFAMLRRNLAPYGSRVNLIHAGVLVAPDSARSLREPLPRRTRVGQAGAASPSQAKRRTSRASTSRR